MSVSYEDLESRVQWLKAKNEKLKALGLAIIEHLESNWYAPNDTDPTHYAQNLDRYRCLISLFRETAEKS